MNSSSRNLFEQHKDLEAKELLEKMAQDEEGLVNRINAMAKEVGSPPQPLIDDLDMQRRHHGKALMDLVVEMKGWPTTKRVGERGVMAAWLVAQHTVMVPEIRDQVCELLKKAADRDEIPLWQYPFYYDRVQQLQGKPQRYGTQMYIHDRGYPTPYTVEKVEGIDALRARYGLPTIEESVKHVSDYMNGKPPPQTKAG